MNQLIKYFYFFLLFFFIVSCESEINNSIKICFTGDLLLDRGVRQRIEFSGVSSLFAGVTSVFHEADAVVANLECPLTHRKSPINKRFIFRGEPNWLSDLKTAGITHLAMANNHTNDQGRDGIEDTHEAITDNHLITIGFGKTHAKACEPVLITEGKTKVAIFNSDQIVLENFPFLPEKPCICQATFNELATSIMDYRKNDKNTFVVVFLHWGTEYQFIPSLQQKIGAKILINAGADAIIGHHPHVIQTIEFINNKPVIYSLGNFIFDSHKPGGADGLIVQLNIKGRDTEIIGYQINIKDCVPRIVKNKKIKE